MTAEWRKRAQPACQDDNLLMFPCAAESIEHPLDAVIIAVDQRVIQDDGNCLSSLG